MLTNDREKKICARFSALDEQYGRVHCSECPLLKGDGIYDFRCKANSHYNRNKREWEYDEYDIDPPNYEIFVVRT